MAEQLKKLKQISWQINTCFYIKLYIIYNYEHSTHTSQIVYTKISYNYETTKLEI